MKTKTITAMIEIPKNSSRKYEYNAKTKKLELNRTLKHNFKYPENYGFIPKTIANDKDPIDILIFSEKKLPKMKLTKVKIIGALGVIDQKTKDNKILAIHHSHRRYNKLNNVIDLTRAEMLKLQKFFDNYKKAEGKKCKVLSFETKEQAIKEIKKARQKYLNKHK